MKRKNQYRFPFGQALSMQETGINDHRSLYVIGAYPSALHVRWIPPDPFRLIQAFAVENEPSVFWDGDDEQNLIDAWKESVSWKDEWGVVMSAGHLNGSSGSWVNNRVVTPLGLQRSDAWFSDCLDTYHSSIGQEKRILDTFIPFADEVGIERPFLPEHPSEDTIVRTATSQHLDRLESELLIAEPGLIVTLGNAALRVIKNLVQSENLVPDKLYSDQKRYGRPLEVIAPGKNESIWLPLAHPGAPEKYQLSHRNWMTSVPKTL